MAATLSPRIVTIFIIHSYLCAFHFDILKSPAQYTPNSPPTTTTASTAGTVITFACKAVAKLKAQNHFYSQLGADLMGLTSFHTDSMIFWWAPNSIDVLSVELITVERLVSNLCAEICAIKHRCKQAKFVCWWWCVTESVSVAPYLHSKNHNREIYSIWIVNRSNLCKHQNDTS